MAYGQSQSASTPDRHGHLLPPPDFAPAFQCNRRTFHAPMRFIAVQTAARAGLSYK